MGNNISKEPEDIKPSQKTNELHGFHLNEKIIVGPHFCIEICRRKDGIYEIHLYYMDNSRNITLIHSFLTLYSLMPVCDISMNEFPIIKLKYNKVLFNAGSSCDIVFSFDFSASFDEICDFGKPLKSMPLLLPTNRVMIRLSDYEYYFIVDVGESLWLVNIISSTRACSGFESIFQNGDKLIEMYSITSITEPFITKNEEDVLVISSADEGFVQVEMRLPTDEISLSNLLHQEQEKQIFFP